MNDLIAVERENPFHKLKALVLDSVSSPITKRVYNLGLDEFFAWYSQESRGGLPHREHSRQSFTDHIDGRVGRERFFSALRAVNRKTAHCVETVSQCD
ncbi:MAG TPA: hypothetical protein VN736_30700 [Candidatus Limnocylindrales bacterium]|nr:hypothetical protein [Candidatus Limnocylindrales bacterium]